MREDRCELRADCPKRVSLMCSVQARGVHPAWKIGGGESVGHGRQNESAVSRGKYTKTLAYCDTTGPERNIDQDVAMKRTLESTSL